MDVVLTGHGRAVRCATRLFGPLALSIFNPNIADALGCILAALAAPLTPDLQRAKAPRRDQRVDPTGQLGDFGDPHLAAFQQRPQP
jgi:hypothetical protein